MKQGYKKERVLRDMLSRGGTVTDISRIFNVDVTTVIYWCKKGRIDYHKDVKYPIRSYKCPVCGKVFKKRQAKETQATYCSRVCAYKGRSLGYTKRRIEGGYNTEPTKVSVICKECGGAFIVNLGIKRKYCSRKCFLKAHHRGMKGEKNPSWKDGRSYKKRCYRGDNWEEKRLECYKRDAYICQICGVKCISRKEVSAKNGEKLIQCHHINGFRDEKDNTLENLVTLCASCHKKVHEGNVEYEMDKS